MAEQLVADAVVERLRSWQVRRIFGYSGDGINGFMGALRRAGGDPAFIQARHEENAAFMAVGHAKYTGSVAVVTSTQGPGAVHLLNGLYDAKLDSVPVVAIVGQQSRSVLGSQYMQEVDLNVLMQDVACFIEQVNSPEQIPMVIDRAFRAALTSRAPAVVILPHDVQKEPAVEPGHSHGEVSTSAQWRPSRQVPYDEDLRAAADVLNAGRKVALLVGQGAKDAQAEVVAVAEKLGAGIATSLLGKPYVDERLGFATGTMGHLGTSASAFLLGNCDTLLIVGSNDPWTEFYPPPGAARAVQIDNNPARTGNRYPVETALVGDAAATLAALLPLLEGPAAASVDAPAGAPAGTPADARTGWRSQVETAVGEWEQLKRERALTPANPVNPERALYELNSRLPSDARLAVDVGSVVYWYARQLMLPPGMQGHLSGTLASMGCSIPYAIAAKLDRPDLPVIALSGDGAMQMAGLTELITVSRMWQQWEDPRLVVCVLNNRELAEVTWEQREMEGDPRFADSQALPDFNYAGYAELLGFAGRRVEDPEQLGKAWDDALAADRPFLIEVISDPDIPLLPPFPGGAEKLESMRNGLKQEGASALEATRLLDVYAEQEDRITGNSPDAE